MSGPRKTRPLELVTDSSGDEGVILHNAFADDGAGQVDGMPVVMRSAIETRYGGFWYPMSSSSHCGVCQSGWRSAIENALTAGIAKARISRELESLHGVKVSPHSMTTHIRHGGMPVPETTSRVALEKRQQELGKIEEEVDDILIDHVALLREVVVKSYQSIVRGKDRVTVRDGIRAAAAMAKIEQKAEERINGEVAEDFFRRFMFVSRRELAPEVYGRLMMAIRGDSVLRELDAKAHPDVVDVESEEMTDGTDL